MQTLTLRCTLKPTPEQAAALEETVHLFAEGCNHALRVARERGEFRRFKLHRMVYRDLRAMGLSANLAVQAIARVGCKKGSRAKFYQPTSCAFDQRTLSLRGEAVSLTTVAGRLVIPMKLGNYQRRVLARVRSVQGGVLTKGPKGKWYIHAERGLGRPGYTGPTALVCIQEPTRPAPASGEAPPEPSLPEPGPKRTRGGADPGPGPKRERETRQAPGLPCSSSFPLSAEIAL